MPAPQKDVTEAMASIGYYTAMSLEGRTKVHESTIRSWGKSQSHKLRTVQHGMFTFYYEADLAPFLTELEKNRARMARARAARPNGAKPEPESAASGEKPLKSFPSEDLRQVAHAIVQVEERLARLEKILACVAADLGVRVNP